MSSELENTIAQQSKIRLDKIKQFYSDKPVWIVIIITCILCSIEFYISKYHEAFNSTIQFILTSVALIFIIVLLAPIITRLLVPLLLRFLMWVGDFIKMMITLLAGVIAEIAKTFNSD